MYFCIFCLFCLLTNLMNICLFCSLTIQINFQFILFTDKLGELFYQYEKSLFDP